MEEGNYKALPLKHNWSPEIKKGVTSILMNDGDPPVILVHFVVAVVDAVKVYGQYGQMTKQYETACKAIDYGLAFNRFVVPHRKAGGQRLRALTLDILKPWIESLCDNFSGNDNDRYYQGDGAAPGDIARTLITGIPPHAITDGANKAADQLYVYHLDNIKAQKDAGLHLTTDAERARELERADLMNKINRVTSGKFFISVAAVIIYV